MSIEQDTTLHRCPSCSALGKPLILTIITAAKEIHDINFPGSYLHRLSGKYQTFWSVSVSGNWRIIFKFEDGDAYDLDYLDYH